MDNPSAFPSIREYPMTGGGSYRDDIPGMTLRDYFAGQALAGIIMTCGGDTDTRKIGHAAYFAMKAYEVADAMLLARQESR